MQHRPLMRGLLITSMLVLCACQQVKGTRVLRVCAAPDNFPFSDRAEHGFENRIARVLAEELGARVLYTWGTGPNCDVVIGTRAGGSFATTRPYYRSSYVFLTRADRDQYFRSLDDARLRPLKLGVEAEAAASFRAALASRGFGEVSTFTTASSLIAAVEKKALDVAILWGPRAGSCAHGDASALRISVINPGEGDAFLTGDVCVGVREDKGELREALDQALERRRDDIDGILREFGVPLTASE
jgi:mxaJ protein